MSLELNETVAQRLRDEQIIWLTTVRSDGTPLPTPVWFLWDGARFLIFTQPTSLKVRNITQRPKVALNFHTDQYGGNVVVFYGDAVLDPNPVSPDEMAVYVEKYREGIKMINMTPETIAQVFSAVLRIQPTRVRVGAD
jgi:PPOX class probable F420-dependent enzyme